MFKNKSIMLVVSHQDDEVLFAGGLLSQIRELNATVHIVCAFAPAPGRKDTATRSDALKDVAKACGATVKQLQTGMTGYPRMRRYVQSHREPERLANRPRLGAHQHPAYNGLKTAISAEIDRIGPDVVVTHNEVGEYGHHEHIFLSTIVADIAKTNGKPTWLAFGNHLGRETFTLPYKKAKKAKLFEHYMPYWDGLTLYPFALEDETYAPLIAPKRNPLQRAQNDPDNVELRPITFEQYEGVYAQYGGTFPTHPTVLLSLEELADIPMTYFGCFRDDQLVGGIPLSGGFIMANGRAMRMLGKPNIIDIGQSEVILPLDKDVRVTLPGKRGLFLSEVTAEQATNAAVEQRFEFALTKGIYAGDNRMSKKSRQNRAREHRKFIDAKGSFVAAQDMSAKELSAEYRRLFQLRRGTLPTGDDLIDAALARWHSILTGEVLLWDDTPVALGLLFKTQTPDALCVHEINSPVDPAFMEKDAGNVLAYHNIKLHEDLAVAQDLCLRYCRGRMSADYKRIWCVPTKAYLSKGRTNA